MGPTEDPAGEPEMIPAPVGNKDYYWWAVRCTACGTVYERSMAMDAKRQARNCCVEVE